MRAKAVVVRVGAAAAIALAGLTTIRTPHHAVNQVQYWR